MLLSSNRGKIAFGVLSLLFVIGCAPPSESPEAEAAFSLSQAEVRLAWAFKTECPPVSGCFKTDRLQGVVEVKDFASDKKVEIVYEDARTGQWKAAPASFLAPAKPGYEAWEFDFGATVGQFAVALTAQGKTLWDNNGGSNYRPRRYTDDAFVVGRKVGGMMGMRRSGTSVLDGWVFVQNVSFHKDVTIAYTDDGWKTPKEAGARYVSTYASGIELWKLEAQVRTSARDADVELATRFAFEGGTAWDNNYRLNYHLEGGRIAR